MRRLQRAWKEAERVLEKSGIRRAPVDVRKIAEQHARIEMLPLDPEISGAVVPLENGQWVILVNADHAPVRQRFTIAHELGHLLLHDYTTPHADQAFKFRDAQSSEGSVLDEIQANQFAAELLMPRRLVMKYLRNWTIDYAADADDENALDAVAGELAKKFNVSRQAMTIRISSLLA